MSRTLLRARLPRCVSGVSLLAGVGKRTIVHLGGRTLDGVLVCATVATDGTTYVQLLVDDDG